MGRTPLASFAAIAAALLVLPVTSLGRPHSDRTTFLLTRAVDGGFANGPSRHATVSHDQRFARWMAFDSDATDLVQGDSNGLTDVFLVKRAGPFGRHGDPWRPARVELASKGMGGQPANGRSYLPSLDGDSHHKPHCVAFVSEASNLVPGDTNGVADGFVRDLHSGRIRRVSVGSDGDQADAATTEVQVDGACERVAFVSAATNLALRDTSRAAWRSARTGSAPPAGVSQVYVHVLDGEGYDAGFRGLTFLGSASRFGRPGNRDSGEIALARDGKALAFTSAATNLARGDGGSETDVYVRTFTRKYVHLGHGRGMQTLRLATRLVSAGERGRAGNGPSRHPAISDTGRYVAYETDATDLFAHDGNHASDIARADMARAAPTQVHVSHSAFSGRANGASHRPVISDAGEFVLFDSEATNLRPSARVRADRNGMSDVFLWNARSGNVSLESRDSRNDYVAGAPAHDPATSARGNYVPFESDAPPLPAEPAPAAEPEPQKGPLDPVVGALKPPPPKKDPPPKEKAKGPPSYEPGAPAPASPQIYVRYLGPE